MRDREPIEIGDGQTFLVIVRGDRVVDYTWAMMPHIEFVKRSVGKLPEDAWVGTSSDSGPKGRQERDAKDNKYEVDPIS